MKNETGGATIKEFVGLQPKNYSFLVDKSSKYKDVFLNEKYLRHSRNRIQSKCHRIGTYEFNKVSLSCFDDKIYPKHDGLALGY